MGAAVAAGGILASTMTDVNFSGFSRPSSSTTETSVVAVQPVPQAVVPQQFHGKWVGQVYQGSDAPYPVELVIAGGAVGATIGSVTYPTLRCGGRWELRATSDNKISAVERIEYQGTCVETVDIDLDMQPDGQALYSFKTQGGGQGVLRRVQ
ncbi:hypothetical protein ACSHWB_22990 [Lentzea sp. HUAS TT2]|uniref:hypothetical protein n=1 Tax=Lentzea sp. HUAS TT2 TaxID=3447454 RepID=UPI003F7311F6